MDKLNRISNQLTQWVSHPMCQLFFEIFSHFIDHCHRTMPIILLK